MTTIVTIASFFSVVAITVTFFVSTQTAILLAYLTKPIIDASWASSFAGVSALRIIGVVLPVFIMVRVASTTKRPQIPLIRLWLIYVVYTGCSFTFQLVFSSNSIDTNLFNIADNTFRVLNGFAGYLMIQCYLADRRKFHHLLICLLIAGIFPLFIGIFQAASGFHWSERSTVGLVRNVGLYHDAFSVRAFVFQTLAAVFLYWSYYMVGWSNIKRASLLILVLACLVVLYKSYSKAGVLILLVWLFIWLISGRKFIPALFIVLCVFVANLWTNDLIQGEIQQLFSKEIQATTEDVDIRVQKRSLGGRWTIWELFWEDYANSSVLEQVFGSGKVVPAHNDFLARLISGGVIGLMLYILLLWSVGVAVVRNYFRNRSPLNVMAVMIFAMWMIDTIGLVPSLYTSYQWFVWGFLGLALQGVEWDLPTKKAAMERPSLVPPPISAVPDATARQQRRNPRRLRQF